MSEVPQPRVSAAFERVAAGLLLVAGLQVSLLVGRGDWPPRGAVVLGAGVGAAVGAAIAALTRRAGGLRPRRSGWTMLGGAGAFAGAVLYLYLTGRAQDRAFAPIYQDEFSYLLQATMIAGGRLWTAPPPAAEFFDSFQVLVSPVYGSVYFPGAALAYAVGVVTGAPTWLVPLLLAGGCVVLMRRVAAELFGPAAGWVAAAMLVSLSVFRLQSLMTMAQVPVLLAGLGMTVAWLSWRRDRRAASAVLVGALAGWAAITRPADALCFAVPIGVAMAVDLRRSGLLATARPAAAVVLAAAPFLVLQGVFNAGATGSVLRTPFGLYAERDNPGTAYGFSGSTARPVSPLPQKQAYYDEVVAPLLAGHTPGGAARRWVEGRIGSTLTHALPHAVVLILLPAGLLALRRPGVGAIVGTAALFPLLYWPYAFYLPHYALTAAPGLIVLTLAGIEAVARALPSRAWRWARAGLLGAVAGVAIAELPEFNRTRVDEFFPGYQLRKIDAALAALPADRRAVVLFTWAPGNSPQEEPVYNPVTIDPFAARLTRAHDLGPERNARLFAYLAATEPRREVYRFDRGTEALTRLGTAGELAPPDAATGRRTP